MWHAWERRENCRRFWWESPKERDHLEDQGVGERMRSEWILRRLAWGGVDWIRLAENRGRWRVVVSAVMNLRVLAPHSYTARPVCNSLLLLHVDGKTIRATCVANVLHSHLVTKLLVQFVVVTLV
jgi:hypothetical protein